jgi:mono/diheme cytochrome c family protein
MKARCLSAIALLWFIPTAWADQPVALFEKHCFDCHSAESHKGNLDLASLKVDLANADNFAKWVKIYDRVASGEMPPPKRPRPAAVDKDAMTLWIKSSLTAAELDRLKAEPRTGLRRLTRAEYENTIRDLFDMPGIVLKDDLPPDGSANGFDKNSNALEISHVNLAKYMDAADRVLDLAIATQPTPPIRKTFRASMACEQSTLGACILEGDGVMLRDKKPDPRYPPAGNQRHVDYTAHLALGMHLDRSPGTSVGLFRHEDDSFRPSFAEFVTIYPGRYRIKTALWSFTWDKGKVLPSPRTETARLDVWHITGDGRGTGHPSTLLSYFDAPSINEQTYEFTRWLNTADTFGFNFTNSRIGHEIRGTKGRLMQFTGPGVACDGLEIDGPIHDQWPPVSHRRLFGDLPLAEFKADQGNTVRPPSHRELSQRFGARNQADPPPHTLKLWTVKSAGPLVDADRLFSSFLPRAFRRPVDQAVRQSYVNLVERRLKAGDCFESAMRWAYKAALCSPDFLYHVEAVAASRPTEKGRVAGDRIDDYALAARLSYFLINSMPDDRLTELATENTLHESENLRAEVERLLKDPAAARFREDFLGQWLKLRKIAANDPDPKLYGEWRVDLQDAMVGETHAFFQELLDKDLGASHLIKSDFAMLNERLAIYYGVPGVVGCKFRRVPVPAGSPRGPFLTQASILKITANGTTSSPVPRGAFVMDRLLGLPPDPPPANIAAVEPDVRGATTIREQLAKHRDNATCASCHARIDPPGFALESFDVIGGQRDRYRTITNVKPLVDPSGVLPDGRPFKDIHEFQSLVAADSDRLLRNMAGRFVVYSTGRGLLFSDREALAAIVDRTKARGGGLRTLIHEVVQSDLFQTR